MIRVESTDDRLVVSGNMTPGTVAYLDSEWLVPGRSGDVPALVFTPDGQISYPGAPGRRVPDDMSTDRFAALVFAVVADEAATVTAGTAVEVTGTGILAHMVRTKLDTVSGDRATDSRPAPDAVVDTTGDPEVIRESTRRLSAFGTLVLVGEMLDRRLDIDLYADVHQRGLHVVGVAPPLADPFGDELADRLEVEVEEAARAPAGTPLPDGARWYRISW
jgi:hypothetical protein